MIKQKMRQVVEFFNKARANKPLLIIFSSWVFLVIFYRLFFQIRPYDTPDWFPISELYLTGFHQKGFVFFVLFWIILPVVLLNIKKLNEVLVIFSGWALIVLGNLMQGGFLKGFLEPFYAAQNQFYNDATLVYNWREWLAAFNTNQTLLLGHTQTHPPFAVLLHNIFLSPTNDKLTVLAIGFSVLSMCTIPLLMIILKLFQVDVQKRKYILLLFSIVPAINVYSIVCLDSVLLTTSTIFLLGIIIILRKPELKILGVALMLAGFITTSLLNYGSLFLLGAGGLLSLYEIFKYKKFTILIGLIICVLTFTGLFFIMKYELHYDYIQSFLTASKQEKILTTATISHFRNYVLTRFEDVSEIALFSSFAVLAIFAMDGLHFKPIKKLFTRDDLIVAYAGIITLLGVFISGAYMTGETTRSCLFIIPFIFMLLLNKNEHDYKWMIFLAALQTSIMQIFFGFYW